MNIIYDFLCCQAYLLIFLYYGLFIYCSDSEIKFYSTIAVVMSIMQPSYHYWKETYPTATLTDFATMYDAMLNGWSFPESVMHLFVFAPCLLFISNLPRK